MKRWRYRCPDCDSVMIRERSQKTRGAFEEYEEYRYYLGISRRDMDIADYYCDSCKEPKDSRKDMKTGVMS